MKTARAVNLIFSAVLAQLFLTAAPAAAAEENYTADTAAQEEEKQPPRAEKRIMLPTSDGWHLRARYFPPKRNRPVFLFLHAQKSNSGDWKSWFPILKNTAYGYLAFDFRGHGASLESPTGEKVSFREFSIKGGDNQYNMMQRDIEAAISYLEDEGIKHSKIILTGYNLGANLAIRAAAIEKDIGRIILFAPVLNVNDVLSVNPLRALSDTPVLFVGSIKNERQFKEFTLLNDIARNSSSKDYITSFVEAVPVSDLLNRKSDIYRVLSWVQYPELPPVTDINAVSDEDENASGENKEDGTTEPEEAGDGSADDSGNRAVYDAAEDENAGDEVLESSGTAEADLNAQNSGVPQLRTHEEIEAEKRKNAK